MQLKHPDIDADEHDPQSEAMIGELASRMAELERTEDQAFGQFTRADWYFCVSAFLVLPCLAYLWFWPA